MSVHTKYNASDHNCDKELQHIVTKCTGPLVQGQGGNPQWQPRELEKYFLSESLVELTTLREVKKSGIVPTFN
jgi:hypothetical protein